jgi:hypothetical protein
MKGVDVLRLRNTHNRINSQITKIQDKVSKKLNNVLKQERELR